MKSTRSIDRNLTIQDTLVLQNLLSDIALSSPASETKKSVPVSTHSSCTYSSIDQRNATESSSNTLSPQLGSEGEGLTDRRNLTGENLVNHDEDTIQELHSLNDPQDKHFEPTIFLSWDLHKFDIPWIDRCILQPFISWAEKVVRHPTDVVMLMHLLLYFTTIVPSALYLFYDFNIVHGVFHWFLQSYFVGTYTLMMHQHIHMGGILSPSWAWFDALFPYITDPLMGHTWNSYYYHHVKHHHVEGNGPNDLSSTLRYQRDDALHFLHYVGRFFFLIWFELARYFISKKKPLMALKASASEAGNYIFIFIMATYCNFNAAVFVFILPLVLLRIGLMVGNWGQHALVDADEPNSDFRSSITLIDVASNRFCFNDGYHTSHHLNPRRHWREHPVAFLTQKHRYAKEQALVFRDIDYIMLTVRVLRKDYKHLAQCLVPIGSQIGMSLDEIAEMLREKTRRFTEEEIRMKFKGPAAG